MRFSTILKRGAKDAWLALSSSIRHIVISSASISGFIFLQYWILGSDKAMDEFIDHAIAIAAAVGFVVIPVFLWNLWLAPYRLVNERLDNAMLTGPKAVSNPSITPPQEDRSIQTRGKEWCGVAELRECHDALTKYQSVPAQSPVSAAEIAASAKLRSYLKRALRVLDQQDVPYPDFDTNAMVINDTLKWSNFLSELLAFCDDLEGAREAARDFCKRIEL